MKNFLFGCFLVLVIFAVIVCFTACSANPTESEVAEDKPSMFVEVESNWSWRIVYHKETKVMYAISRGNSNQGNFTVLVNPDGSPMIWEEDRYS